MEEGRKRAGKEWRRTVKKKREIQRGRIEDGKEERE